MVYNFLKIYFWIQCAKNCSILPSFFSLPLLCSYIPSLISSYFLFCTVFVFGISFIKWVGNYFHLLFPERDIVELWQGCPQKMWGLEIPLLEVLKIQIQFPWYQFSSVQSLSHVRLFATPWIAVCQASLSITLPEFTQTHVHQVGDAIQPSHPLSFPSPPAPNPSQHQSFFQWVNSLHKVAKVLEFQPQHQSFQWTPRTGFL